MSDRRFFFIVNPISGGKQKEHLIVEIKNSDACTHPDDVYLWHELDHLQSTIEQLDKEKYTHVVIVGGDGTLNHVINHLDTNAFGIGIIPAGSGNGLARALNIPLYYRLALAKLTKTHERLIDLVRLDDRIFCNVAGFGFESEVSSMFSNSERRGKISYFQSIVSLFKDYVAQSYKIEFDGKAVEGEFMMVSFANGPQWGNDFYVARNAKIDDGLVDLILTKKPKLHQIPKMVLSLRRGMKHKLIQNFRSASYKIYHDSSAWCHLDGEPHETTLSSEIISIPKALRVIA